MIKEIIGYKFRDDKPEYIKAACAIEGYEKCGNENLLTITFNWNEHTEALAAWVKAGVLDLWFTPVYESEQPL
jgi:hypothetical protein